MIKNQIYQNPIYATLKPTNILSIR